MAYKTKVERNQMLFISLEDLVSNDSEARVVDAYVDSLNLSKFKYNETASTGNRPYNPADMLKLYLFGEIKRQRSSRRLAYFAQTNTECIWLLKGLTPDFRTISDFRKDNINLFKEVFFDFNKKCKALGVITSNNSQDGTKLKANNSKDKNYTLSKIDDRKKHVQNHIDEILKTFDINDEIDDIQDKIGEKAYNLLKQYKDKLEYLTNMEKEIIENKDTQKSLTDPDSKLMKNNGKFDVCYNNQVLVNSDSHLIVNYNLDNNPADLKTITPLCTEAKDVYDMDIITDVTDKGYNSREDMVTALENGIIPEVTPLDGKSGFVLETEYEESEITEEDKNSKDPKDIKKCLRAGVIPTVYKDNIESIEVIQVTKRETIEEDKFEELSDEELRDIAMNEWCFSRNLKDNKVFCPMGEILRQKSKTDTGTRYYNKLACKLCKNPCTTSEYKVVEFQRNNSFVGRDRKTKRTLMKRVSRVVIKTKPNLDLLKMRMQTSEHPHASMKRWDDSSYLLLKSKEKVNGEVGIYYTAYNIRRMINIFNVDNLVNYFKHGVIPSNNEKSQEKIANIESKTAVLTTIFDNIAILLLFLSFTLIFLR